MNLRSLRFRLAVWYFCTVAAIFSLALGAYWLATRTALHQALDQGLRYRLIGLRHFVESIDPGDNQTIASRLNDISQLGDLFQVFDANGILIAQSFGLQRHEVPQVPPHDLGSQITYDTGGTPDFQLRRSWQKITVEGRTLILGLADPQRKYEGVEQVLASVLLISTPVILGLAIVCGLWLGRRALSPVARITDDARAISETNLSARLAVPQSQDELQQLSETLNDMLDRIEQSFTRNKQFTADASHELRAPITLIHTAAEFSLRKERSREELVENMQKILRESKRTTALIDDLLALARGDVGNEEAGPQPLDIVPLLRDLADQAMAMASGKKIDVVLQLESDVLPVKANEQKLRQLILILIDNGIKYASAGGRLTIRGCRTAADVEISVSDTGAGISPEELPHIFERFWRADKVRSRQTGGTGLGLAIAKQIAQQQGASIKVESEVGRGSLFTLSLPTAG